MLLALDCICYCFQHFTGSTVYTRVQVDSSISRIEELVIDILYHGMYVPTLD